MSNWLWILFVLQLMFSATLASFTRHQCKVSDWTELCSSSHAVSFVWTLEGKWKKNCNTAFFLITTVDVNTNRILTNRSVTVVKQHVSLAGLEVNKRYRLEVNLCYKNDMKKLSKSHQTIDITTQEPGKPEGLSAGVEGPRNVKVSWAVPAKDKKCVSRYTMDVCRQDSCITYWESVPAKDVWLQKDLSGLEPCTQYRVTVTAVDRYNTSSTQDTSVTFVTDFEEPSAVSELISTNVTADSVTVTWNPPVTAPACVHGYRVTLYVNQGTLVEFIDVGDNVTSHTFSSLQDCSQYDVSVQGMYKPPDSGYTKALSVRLYTAVKSDIQVANLHCSSFTDSGMWVNWEVSGHVGCPVTYLVQVSSVTTRLNLTTEARYWHKTDLQPCTDYSVSVTAVFNGQVLLQSSATTSVKTLSPPPDVLAKERVYNIRDFNTTSDSLLVTWDGPFSVSCVKMFFVLLEDSKTQQIIKNSTTTERNFQFSQLKPCEEYTVMVRQIYHQSYPAISPPLASFKTSTAASDTLAVSDLRVLNVSAVQVTLGWTPPQSSACVTAYHVNISGEVHITSATHLTWAGNQCSVGNVSVTLKSQGHLVGTLAYLDVFALFYNRSQLSAEVTAVESTKASVRVISSAFTCFNKYDLTLHSKQEASRTIYTDQSVSQLHYRSVTQLWPCSDYTVEAHARGFDFRTRGLYVNTTITTKYQEPVLTSEVKQISGGFNVSWKAQHNTGRCLRCVNVVIHGTGVTPRIHQEMNVTDGSYNEFRSLIPCREYSISLSSVGINGVKGMAGVFLNTVAAQVFHPPRYLSINVTNSSATVGFNPRAQPNDCGLTRFQVKCQPQLSNTPRVAGDQPVLVYLTGLTPNTNYSCEGWSVNKAGASSSTSFFFITSEGLPSQPRNVSVEVISSSEVRVTWSPVDLKNHTSCSSTCYYTVTVQDKRLLQPLPPGCDSPSMNSLTEVVPVNTTAVTLQHLPADMEFRVTVTAVTKVGAGPSSAPITAQTLTNESEPVRNLSVFVTQDTTTVTWDQPCLTRGPLDHFIITLNNTEELQQSVRQAVVKSLDEPYGAVFNTTALIGDATYTVTVVPVGSSGVVGKQKSTHLTVPPRIPAVPNATALRSLLVEAASTKAVVYLRNDIFPSSEGTIVYYALLLAEIFPHGPHADWLHNDSWPRTQTWAEALDEDPISPYQTTPEYWNPFAGSEPETIQFKLGSEECSRNVVAEYCNGPLVPRTTYFLRVRGFTRAGFRDSESTTFTTADEDCLMSKIFVVALVLVMFAVLCVVFVYLVATRRLTLPRSVFSMPPIKSNEITKREGMFLPDFLLHAETILASREELIAEFNLMLQLTKLINISQAVVSMEHNKKKNRYLSIMPYDFNRVVLEGDETDDYVNASYIQFEEVADVRYVACQAPRGQDCARFWRMLVQCKVQVVVMLCLPVEKNREKCFVYFPQMGDAVTHGGVNIRCINESEFHYYTIRSLLIDQGGDISEIKHIHFTNWADFDVPKSASEILEVCDVLSGFTKGKNPVIAVHCSAGIGRTGTFIAVDFLLRHMRQGWICHMNVLDTVLRLREQRRGMVQTEKQYEYIYQCVFEATQNNPPLSVKLGVYLSKRRKTNRKKVAEESVAMEDLSLKSC